MRTTRTACMAIAVVVVGAALLGTGVAQAADVIFDPADPDKVIGIENLDIGGTAYNVAFTATQTTANQVYGDFPGVFDFDTDPSAAAAVDAVTAELTAASAVGVGAEGSAGVPFFRAGFSSGMENDLESVFFWEALRGDGTDTTWVRNADPDVDGYNFGQRLWADFSAVPEPGAGLMLALGLAGLGVLRRRRQK